DSLEEERRALDTCLQKLPADHRQLVQAAYAPGVKIEKLAQQSRRTPMALYKTLHRIRLKLMDCTQLLLTSEEPI
ncbi:MAG: hypothetical protein RL693_2232, partial [Verrucomicrobiota bacterium]